MSEGPLGGGRGRGGRGPPNTHNKDLMRPI